MNGGLRVDRLEELMRARAYGPGELAYHSGLSYDYIYKIRKGHAPNIAAVQVQRLAGALKTTTDYLLGLTDDPNVPGDVLYAWVDDVTDLALRLNQLPAAQRERLLPIFEAILGLTNGAVAPAPPAASWGQAERTAQFVRLFEALSAAEQEALHQQLAELVAAKRRAANE